MICPCNEKNLSKILYESNYKNRKLDVKCTSEVHEKPTLYKCRKCNLIFSEYIETNFEESYTDVEDQKYIQQIPFKKKYFELFLTKIKSYLNADCNVLEIGSYYGVLGSIIKPYVKDYTGLELSRHAVEYSKKNFKLNIINKSLSKFFEKQTLYLEILELLIMLIFWGNTSLLPLLELGLKYPWI